MALLSVDAPNSDRVEVERLATSKPTQYGSTRATMVTRRVGNGSRGPSPVTSGDEAASAPPINIPSGKMETKTTSWPTSPRNGARVLSELMDRYRLACSTKMYDVEELIDFYFHRRLAAVPAVVVSYLPFVITPNQITLFGLALGWAAAVCLYDSEFHAPLDWQPTTSLAVAAALMFTWIVSDCTDGQVARLCKRGTRTGRILDGIVDGLVIFPNCVVIGMLLQHRYGSLYFALATVGGVSLWIHALIYDKIKNVYTENASPVSECDGETVESVAAEYAAAKAKAPWSLDAWLLFIYAGYVKLQVKFTSASASKAEEERLAKLAQCDDDDRARYQAKYSGIVRLASFMGISAHVAGLYVGYTAAIFYWDAFIYVELYFAVVLNVLFVTVLVLYSKSGMASHTPGRN